jgi:hypothetical protein
MTCSPRSTPRSGAWPCAARVPPWRRPRSTHSRGRGSTAEGWWPSASRRTE